MMEVYTSDSSDTDSRELKTLTYSRENLTYIQLADGFKQYAQNSKSLGDIETILLNHNRLIRIPITIKQFYNLRTLDLSSNNLGELPEAIFELGLVTLIAKNNHLTNDSLPKSLLPSKAAVSTLKELNLSGNMMIDFPEQCLDLHFLKYLYIGGNKIRSIPKDVWKMASLQILSMGGNLLTEVPDTVGNLHQLQALVLCDNLISSLPTSIAKCKNLKSLLLHKNRLRHLPKDIVALQNLTELSLRENPLVVRFVQDICLSPPTLMELSGRMIKSANIPYGPKDLPPTVIDYLNCANCCVNPNCQGVYFDNRVEHIKFVDFCGKYRVPLLQYLCSSKCIKESPGSTFESQPGASGYMMRKVLLG